MSDQKTITSMMDERRTFNPSPEFVAKARVKSREEYAKLYQRSIEDPEAFWGEAASQLHWFQKWHTINEENFAEAQIKWFVGGKTNVCYNCLDRHLGTPNENKVALIWQGEPEDEVRKFTYRELLVEVSRFANVLKKKGIKKGDRVTLYMPMIPELSIAMLACARIGAIHSIVFGGFSADSLKDRILDCDANSVITANVGLRSGKAVPLKANVDKALEECPGVKTVVVVERTPARGGHEGGS